MQLKKEMVFLGSLFEGTSLPDKKIMGVEHKASSPIISTVWKCKEKNGGAQLLQIFRLGALPPEWCFPHFG